jgi:ubiquinone/menaquinone biosynthesis C-methylase UbiE
MESSIKLNLGCGERHLEGYINIDAFVWKGPDGQKGKEPDVRMDIRKLEFPDNTADEILAVHVIEHFRYSEVLDILKEWYRVLKPGGKLVLELPDLSKCIGNLIRYPNNATMSLLGIYGDPRSQHDVLVHKWGWTPETLGGMMYAAGFREIMGMPTMYHFPERDMRIEGVKDVIE